MTDSVPPEPTTRIPIPGMDMAETWMQMTSEFQAFLAARLEEDIKAQRQFLACRTPAEVMEVQAAFFQKAMEDYRAEGGRMLERAAKLGFPQPGGQPKT